MDDLEKNGNLIEAGVWFAVALVLVAKAWRVDGRLRRIFSTLAGAFFVFGISDLIEAQTGAWWRPLWLLAMKVACVAVFFFGFRAYYRMKGKSGP